MGYLDTAPHTGFAPYSAQFGLPTGSICHRQELLSNVVEGVHPYLFDRSTVFMGHFSFVLLEQ